MDRILQGIASTIQVELTRDGTAEDPAPDSATVQIVRWSDGTTVYSGAAIDIDVPPGVFAHTLSPTDTALLDRFTATWTFTFDSVVQTVQTVVEVVGGFLFSIGEAKAVPGMTTANSDDVLAYRTLVETELEDACGRAFAPRYTQETIDGSGTFSLMLSKPEIRRIRSVTASGTAYTPEQIAALAMSPTGLVTSTANAWPLGTTNITVGYEYGPDFPPPGAKRAGLTLFKMWLGGVNRPIDDRAITFNTTEGGTYSLAVPGRNGSIFGHPDVDAFVARNSLHAGVA